MTTLFLILILIAVASGVVYLFFAKADRPAQLTLRIFFVAIAGLLFLALRTALPK